MRKVGHRIRSVLLCGVTLNRGSARMSDSDQVSERE